jgi:hypothetical protein
MDLDANEAAAPPGQAIKMLLSFLVLAGATFFMFVQAAEPRSSGAIGSPAP